MDDYQRYLTWKKNARHLYDTLLLYELPWPSLTVQFFPELLYKKNVPGGPSESLINRTVQRVLLATNTAGQAPEYLRIGELTLPEIVSPQTLAEYDAEQGTIGGYHSDKTADFRIVQRIQCQGVVSRARYMPQNPNVVATVASTGEAALWDVTKFPYKPVDTYVPTVKLLGHKEEVLAVDWSPVIEAQLATCDANGGIFLWNMAHGYDSRTGVMQPLTARDKHIIGTAVNCIQWHPHRVHVLASVGDDGWLHIHNSNNDTSPLFMSVFLSTNADGNTEASAPKPTSLAWNPVNDSLMAIGFDTGMVQLWDLSTTEAKMIHQWTNAHSGYITQMAWNTHHPSVLATASEDKLIKIWDASMLETTDPLFVHGGHSAPVTDLGWNPAERGTLVSVDEGNSMQVWRPTDDLIGF